jgi:hypothetical protein
MVLMSPAVTAPGPGLAQGHALGPSPCILIAIALMFRTMSVTSSRTPGIDENSCSTPSIWTAVTAAPWSEDSRTRRSALPSVRPKPRSSGSRDDGGLTASGRAGLTWSLFGLTDPASSSDHDRTLLVTGLHARPYLAAGAPRTGAGRPAGAASTRRANQTRRRLRGRQPLCGIGVTSRIEVTVKPAACSARSADSRPEPGPPPRPRACACRAPAPCGQRPRPRPARHRGSTCASP